MADDEVDAFDYTSEVNRMLIAARFLADLNIDGISKAIGDAHNIGWAIDPTAYRDALQRGDMDAIAELAAALREPIRIYTEKITQKALA